MQEIMNAVLVLGGIGAVCAVVLVIAAKFMAVPADETAKRIEEALPGANCGACSFAGCADYAAAVARGDAAPNLCVPGGASAAKAVSAIMGVAAGEVEQQVAFVACHGSYDSTDDKFDYRGISSCTACNMFYGGKSSCSYGCIGMGDCVSVCRFGAISVKNGVAHVDPSKCTGCGMCAAKCPKGLIHIVPLSAKSVVVCSNKDRGALTHKTCIRGCIGCAKCVRVCPNGAMTIENNLAIVDLSKCKSCGACVLACPVHARGAINELV